MHAPPFIVRRLRRFYQLPRLAQQSFYIYARFLQVAQRIYKR